jgi:hypothetical protein
MDWPDLYRRDVEVQNACGDGVSPVCVRAPDQVIGGQVHRGCQQWPVAGGGGPVIQPEGRGVRGVGQPGPVEQFSGAGQLSP